MASRIYVNTHHRYTYALAGAWVSLNRTAAEIAEDLSGLAAEWSDDEEIMIRLHDIDDAELKWLNYFIGDDTTADDIVYMIDEAAKSDVDSDNFFAVCEALEAYRYCMPDFDEALCSALSATVHHCDTNEIVEEYLEREFDVWKYQLLEFIDYDRVWQHLEENESWCDCGYMDEFASNVCVHFDD